MIPQHRNSDGATNVLPQRRLYPYGEAAELLGGITDRMLRDLVAKKKIQAVNVGRRRMIPAEAIENYVRGLIADAGMKAAA